MKAEKRTMNLFVWILVLNFFLCWTSVDAQMGFDVPLTAHEQMYILYEIKQQCYQNLSNIDPWATDEVCPPDWDGLICWPGLATKVPCPTYIFDFNHKGHAYRTCDVNGSWVFSHPLNKTWTNYSECFLQPSDEKGRQDFFERLCVMYTIGYAVSFSSLMVAIFIIGYFRLFLWSTPSMPAH